MCFGDKENPDISSLLNYKNTHMGVFYMLVKICNCGSRVSCGGAAWNERSQQCRRTNKSVIPGTWPKPEGVSSSQLRETIFKGDYLPQPWNKSPLVFGVFYLGEGGEMEQIRTARLVQFLLSKSDCHRSSLIWMRCSPGYWFFKVETHNNVAEAGVVPDVSEIHNDLSLSQVKQGENGLDGVTGG